MKLNKIILGATLALGLTAFSTEADVKAAEWEARTVEEVTADFKTEANSSKSYSIQWGDTLAVIAAAADVNVSTLVEINDINNADMIFPGNKISFKSDENGKIEEVTVEDVVTDTVETYSVEETYYAKPVVEQTYAAQPAAYVAPAEETYSKPVQAAATVSTSSAKEQIAMIESTNNYNATNGSYIGKYQLTDSYLNGDYSPANQERVADEYVASRYGSWDAALAFHMENGWY